MINSTLTITRENNVPKAWSFFMGNVSVCQTHLSCFHYEQYLNLCQSKHVEAKAGNQRIPTLLSKSVFYWILKSDDIDWPKFLRHFRCEGKKATSCHKGHFEGVFVGSHCRCRLGKHPLQNLFLNTDFWTLVISVRWTCVHSLTFSLSISQPPWWRYP